MSTIVPKIYHNQICHPHKNEAIKVFMKKFSHDAILPTLYWPDYFVDSYPRGVAPLYLKGENYAMDDAYASGTSTMAGVTDGRRNGGILLSSRQEFIF